MCVKKTFIIFCCYHCFNDKDESNYLCKKKKKKNEIDFLNSSILPRHNKHLYVSIEDGESVKAEKDSVLKKLYTDCLK